MKKAQWVSIALCSAGLLLGANSHAEGFYFALSGGVSSLDTASRSSQDALVVETFTDDDLGISVANLDSSLDDSGKVWGVEVGYLFNPYIGVEVGYIDLGKAVYDADFDVTDGFDSVAATLTERLSSTGVTAGVIGLLPLGKHFDVHAKAGVYFSNTRDRLLFDSEIEDSRVQDQVTDKETDIYAGLGATFNFNESYAIRADYRRFFDVGGKKTGEADVDVFTLSVLFR